MPNFLSTLLDIFTDPAIVLVLMAFSVGVLVIAFATGAELDLITIGRSIMFTLALFIAAGGALGYGTFRITRAWQLWGVLFVVGFLVAFGGILTTLGKLRISGVRSNDAIQALLLSIVGSIIFTGIIVYVIFSAPSDDPRFASAILLATPLEEGIVLGEAAVAGLASTQVVFIFAEVLKIVWSLVLPIGISTFLVLDLVSSGGNKAGEIMGDLIPGLMGIVVWALLTLLLNWVSPGSFVVNV